MKSVRFLLTLTVLALSASIASDPSPLQDLCVAVDEPHKALFVNGKFYKDPKGVKPEDFFTARLNIPGNTNNPAYDPSPLQDFCVAVDEPHKALFVNGKFCKDPKDVKAEDFFTTGLNIPGNTDNPVGSKVTAVGLGRIPKLDTLGILLVRIDYALYGQNPPHTHPRGTEILVVVEGTLYVGFVTSDQQDGKNRLFTKVLNKGDVFVFPIGLIHFQFNKGHTPAVAFAGLSSQNAGVITIANAVFGSDPPINPDVLAKAFQVDNNIINLLQKQFWYDNN